ncbi:hypothetical protein [Paenibacillus alvei]|uniref:hypothetical protein n=1 Tax=Paenibacillus alvei TaxID=44250 RepID=UPI0018CFC1F1|nr:hypothetical protein [Paenibacillus alvei]MCY9579585.1 hypothetical protein [Paenibacillus alvei]MCY9586545.1 hypothetical protein [Paenibacillus alvei]
MNNDELKAAMTSGEPVEHRGITYNHISAIMYRKSETGVFMQVELLDKTRNSVVIASPVEVRRLEKK